MGNIIGVVFYCEGKWMVSSLEDGIVKIWEMCMGVIQCSYNYGCFVNDVVIYLNQGEIISCDCLGSVCVWDLVENNCFYDLIFEEDVLVFSVIVVNDGSLLCVVNNVVRFK